MGGLRSPGFAATHNGVQHREKFTRGRDDGDELGLPGGYEFVAERLELRIEPGGDQSGHELDGAHALASAADEALAIPLARLPRERRKALQRRKLSAVERSELRQLRDRRARHGRADARNGAEQILLLGPTPASRARCRQFARIPPARRFATVNIPLPPLRLATAKTLGMQSSYGNIELSLFGNIVLRSCGITRMPQYPNAGMPHAGMTKCAKDVFG